MADTVADLDRVSEAVIGAGGFVDGWITEGDDADCSVPLLRGERSVADGTAGISSGGGGGGFSFFDFFGGLVVEA